MRGEPDVETLRGLLDRLWSDHAALNAQAKRIHALLEERGERVVNDHVALRTFGGARVGIDALAAPFVRFGYVAAASYRFPEKKLRARHYEHAGVDLPKIFVSELDTAALDEEARGIVARLVSEVGDEQTRRLDFPVCDRPWQVSSAEYAVLREASEYAAWLAAFGFRANHFTVSVNALRTFDGIAELNAFLEEQGFELNAAGGKIKGSPEELLEQSSTLAEPVEVGFSDGVRTIPGCYYEFARRYPGPDGRLFQGFVAKSADKIFESTDAR